MSGSAGDRRRQAVPAMQCEGGKDLQEISKAGGPEGYVEKKAEILSPAFKKKLGAPVFVHTDLAITQPCNCILRQKVKS